MKEVRVEIEILAPASRVWDVLMDFDSFPDWNPFIQRASGKAEEGARLEVFLQPPKGIGITVKPTVVRVQQHREFRWLGHLLVSGIFDGEHYFLIEPIDDEKVRFVQGERFTGLLVPFFGKPISNAVKGFEEMNQALKERSEAQQ